jgi:hypothetical protein
MEISSTVAEPQTRPRLLRLALALGCIAALLPLYSLDPRQRQIGLTFSWLAAMLLYLLQWPRPRMTWRPSRWLLIALAAYAAILFVAFCSVYDGWRWAATGDSLQFYGIGEELARGNPAMNPLGARGVFEQCTVVQAALQNVFMHFSQSLFAHRLGNLLTSSLIVLSAAWLAAQTSGATAAVLVAVFLPVNHVFDVFTLLSLPNLSGVLPYYAVYALFGAAWKRWDSGFLWAALGLSCGLAGYFLPLWLAAVAIVSGCVVLSAIVWRTPRIVLIWAGGAAIALAPALLQFETFVAVLFVFRPMSGVTPEYVLRIAQQSALLPYQSDLCGSGACGPWVRPPFGYLWVAGLVLALVSGVLALLRRSRPPTLAHAWVWLLFFATDVVGLAMGNSGYPVVSVKRAIVMLPHITFFLALPLAWLIDRVGRASVAFAVTLLTLLPYAYLNAATLWWEIPYGFNLPDGLVRITQTAPSLPVLLVSPNPDLHKDYGSAGGGNELYQTMFRLRERTKVSSAVPVRREDFESVVCFSRHVDGHEWGARVIDALAQLCPGKSVEQITAHLECVTCGR